MIEKKQIDGFELVSFGNESKAEKKLLKKFVDFHWELYKDEPNYVPLLDYEYLGFKLIGMTGFFESKNLFFKHAEMRFFMVYKNEKLVGRCNAFVNHRHNEHWQDKTGFFGQFECLQDEKAAAILLEASEKFLKKHGMDTMRGPQNLPVNDATPGFMTKGFDSRPVMYYHYNKPYYPKLVEKLGMKPVKRVLSWEVIPQNPMEEKLERICQKIIDRYDVKIEAWNERPLDVRKKEMLEIYNAAWNDNYGFVPFTQEEFDQIIDDMLMIMDKKLFIFLYIKDEPAAFFGGVPNVAEKLKRIGSFRHLELIRAIKLILGAKKTKGFRLGYLGVKPKFRRLGLDGVMIWKQKQYTRTRYTYCDMGWVLEDNKMVIRIIEMMGSEDSKTYTIYEKKI
ncbi:MAG: hypothetical protein K9N09_00725 [Candidatus Cloacimonetes bacterium]|nr:hypothetical protein [Candidatus Cloacimonadota bacterium]MCF7813061.1 hypothetical protein [Candidatus Cloacimonadota bacterium]MCF7867198.1 hypothetical protein [Candidatus Cloacimonadota bacterium]MCF7882642.1 hypothetical protein [Candidatus Cloacimonadota bacterium]